MSTDKVHQDEIDKRFVIDRQIEDLIGSAFEDYQMDGIRYVASEVKRVTDNIIQENETGKII
jgi:hypothetical protein